MSRLMLCVLIFVFFSSCSPMKRQKPTIDPVDLRAECINVYNLLSKHWYKHKSKKCHEVGFHYQIFCRNNKVCLEHLSKAEVIQLFGQPDDVLYDDVIRYIIKENCKEESMAYYHKLEFFFIEGGNRVEISDVVSIE